MNESHFRGRGDIIPLLCLGYLMLCACSDSKQQAQRQAVARCEALEDKKIFTEALQCYKPLAEQGDGQAHRIL